MIMDYLIKPAGWILPEPGRAGSLRVATIGMTAVVLCASLAAVMMLAALGYVVAAFWLLARSSFGHVGALLVVAILLTGILVAIAWLIMTGLSRRPGARGPYEYEPLTEDQALPDNAVHEGMIPRSDIGRRPAVVCSKKQLKRRLQPNPQNVVCEHPQPLDCSLDRRQ